SKAETGFHAARLDSTSRCRYCPLEEHEHVPDRRHGCRRNGTGGGIIMAQGRFAVLGAGMLLCTGLAGCMDNDPKPTKALPKAGTQTGIPGSSVKTGPGTTYDRGPQPLGYNAPTGGRTPPNNDYFKTGAVGGTGTFGAPSVPGPTGAGASMAPGGNPAIPGITPGGQSNYPG